VSDQVNGGGADLLALMRADRKVQNRRRGAHALIDLEVDKKTVPTERRVARRRRKVVRCPVCDVGPDKYCEMCGSFENCPRRKVARP
jgi:hypothetical protein